MTPPRREPPSLDLAKLLVAVENAPPVAAADVLGEWLAQALGAFDVSFLASTPAAISRSPTARTSATKEKLAAYRRLADDYFEVDRYHEFCAGRLTHVDELVLTWVSSADFDHLFVSTVQSTYPAHEHDRFIDHLRGLVGQWVHEHDRHPQWAADPAC